MIAPSNLCKRSSACSCVASKRALVPRPVHKLQRCPCLQVAECYLLGQLNPSKSMGGFKVYGLAGRSERGGVGGASSLGSLASVSSCDTSFGVAEGLDVTSESSSPPAKCGSFKLPRSIGGLALLEAIIEAASLSRSLWPTEGRLDERNGELPLRRWDGNTDFGFGGISMTANKETKSHSQISPNFKPLDLTDGA